MKFDIDIVVEPCPSHPNASNNLDNLDNSQKKINII